MRVIERHPLWLRIVHWINVPALLLMIWSGLLIYWANDVYPLFFPDWVYKTFHLEGRLAQGMAVHFTVAWILILNGATYLVVSTVRKHWKSLVPTAEELKTLPDVMLADAGLRPSAKHLLHGEGYNPAQKLAYLGVSFLGLIEILTGFAIYKPVQLGWLRAVFGGYESARLIHFLAMLGFSAFVLMHVTQVIRAGWNNFRAMVAGFEVRS